MWKKTNDVPPLPPLVRRMSGRPQKSRIKAPGETSGSHTSRVVGYCASKGRGRGRGRGGSENEASSGVVVEWVCRGRRGGGRGNRAVGSTRRGMARSSSMGILTSEE
ncbi:hypothetical protein Tco_0056299, partial [Tanacetum coccineum]